MYALLLTHRNRTKIICTFQKCIFIYILPWDSQNIQKKLMLVNKKYLTRIFCKNQNDVHHSDQCLALPIIKIVEALPNRVSSNTDRHATLT